MTRCFIFADNNDPQTHTYIYIYECVIILVNVTYECFREFDYLVLKTLIRSSDTNRIKHEGKNNERLRILQCPSKDTGWFNNFCRFTFVFHWINVSKIHFKFVLYIYMNIICDVKCITAYC